jgi:Protein of unknown function (DUF4199)
MEENATTQPTVLSTALKYGLFIGVFSIVFTFIMIMTGSNPLTRDWKDWSGWVSFVISVTLLVLAHKNFKDTGNGYMSYGQGLGIAFVAMMVSMILNFIFMYVYTSFVDPGVLEAVWQKTADDMAAKGQSQEVIDTAIGWTKKLFWVFYFIFASFFALIVGLIIPIFTQKRNPEIPA